MRKLSAWDVWSRWSDGLTTTWELEATFYPAGGYSARTRAEAFAKQTRGPEYRHEFKIVPHQENGEA